MAVALSCAESRLLGEPGGELLSRTNCRLCGDGGGVAAAAAVVEVRFACVAAVAIGDGDRPSVADTRVLPHSADGPVARAATATAATVCIDCEAVVVILLGPAAIAADGSFEAVTIVSCASESTNNTEALSSWSTSSASSNDTSWPVGACSPTTQSSEEPGNVRGYEAVVLDSSDTATCESGA